MDLRAPVLAILVAGTPAPGINAVISASATVALKGGCSVIGITEGFRQLTAGHCESVSIQLDDVQHISHTGGSILKTSKRNIDTEQELDNALRALQHMRVRYLISIGGVVAAYAASRLSVGAAERRYPLAVCHVPKTIFNDLPLRPGNLTFGFATAREIGLKLVNNLMNDARTLQRWYFVTVIGSRSGHLALGIGKVAQAKITIIPEDFPEGVVRFSTLCDVMEACIVKRRVYSKNYGIAILSEGLAEILHKEDFDRLFSSIKEAHSDLGLRIAEELDRRFEERKLVQTLVARSIGMEMRGADPGAVDVEIATNLGYGAAQYLLKGMNGAMIGFDGAKLTTVQLTDMVDAENHISRIRTVNTKGLKYQVAQQFMWRLHRWELDDPAFCLNMARAGHFASAQEVLDRFGPIAVDDIVEPLFNDKDAEPVSGV